MILALSLPETILQKIQFISCITRYYHQQHKYLCLGLLELLAVPIVMIHFDLTFFRLVLFRFWMDSASSFVFFISVVMSVIFLLVSVQHFLNTKVQETAGDSTWTRVGTRTVKSGLRGVDRLVVTLETIILKTWLTLLVSHYWLLLELEKPQEIISPNV